MDAGRSKADAGLPHRDRGPRAARHLRLSPCVMSARRWCCCPRFAGRNLIQDLIFMFYMLALAQCWNLLAGYAGLVSVGQQAFVGLGGYLLFALTLLAGIDPLLAILLAGLVAALFALPTALSCSACAAPISRSAPGSWPRSIGWSSPSSSRSAAAPARRCRRRSPSSVPGIEWVKTLLDVRTPAARDIVSYWVALALMVGTLALSISSCARAAALRSARSATTRPRPQSLGVDIYRIKLGVYVATAAMTGMVGALIYLQKARISPDAAFSVLDWTAYVIFIVVIGGIGTIEGPIVGVIVFYLMQRYLADFGAWYLILLGHARHFRHAVRAKGPLGPRFRSLRSDAFPTRRRLVILRP